ncbi:nucleoside hydrolase [Nesterenkonia sp. AN1]|uniref:Purine nucleosidase/pyrimidine-specific ribonucleoside hydrolase n=1 Tax=Nesterenkonia aurantiaca TaxID=1436010 RepID=A0A4R7G655_9MICC|nr:MULTISPECIES: nucleoside hydrolase [Nesterenkonia]EXF23923.1 nucleoside hydrolase [Nesterenkonia sp. AN1]TDS86954.1 purine nucleosidase/pyrimidine-specific ribonucleoside hydrolase [Nesterenkonia aurantiaca]
MVQVIPLFLDCDPGIDDALALGWLFCQDDVEILGIAASGGNVSTAQVLTNTLGWLQLAGRTELSVHPGAEHPLAGASEYAEETHGDTGAGYARLPTGGFTADELPAAQAWVRAARAYPGELIGVLTGPATNLALALQLEPQLPQLLKRLFIMGGAFNYRGNTRPTTEWNVSYDPEATKAVIDAFGASTHLPVIGPIEATEAVALTPERLQQMLDRPRSEPWSGFLDQLAEALRFYFEFHETDGHGYLAHVHDPYVTAAAVAWARNQTAAEPEQDSSPHGAAGIIPWAHETEKAAVDVELLGSLTRGETVADWLGRWGRVPNAEIIRSLDAEAFLEHLTITLRQGPQHHGSH